MAFHDDLARHAEQVRSRLPHISGEEATKQALVIRLQCSRSVQNSEQLNNHAA